MKLRHACEPQVSRALTLPVPEQKKAFVRLINEGNFKHNMTVLGRGNGELLLRRRPKNGNIPISKFVPCPGCLGFMLRVELNRHGRSCEFVEDPSSATARAEVLLDKFRNAGTPKVVSTIRDEETRALVLADDTLMAFASYTEESKGLSKNQQKVLKTRLSKLTKLLLLMRQKTGESDLSMESLCRPERFDAVVQATKEIGGFTTGTEERNSSFSSPSVPRVVGQALGKVVHILQGKAIRDQDAEAEATINNFGRLLASEWPDRVSRVYHQTFNERQQKKDDAIPSTEDIKKLSNFLKSGVEEATKSLTTASPSAKVRAYNRLAELTMVSVLVFNKRRGGEAAKVKLADYTERADYTQNETIVQSLSELERELVTSMTLIKTSGKRQRNVPVLITPANKRAIDVLIAARADVGVSGSSALFARAPKGNALDSWYALKKACRDAGVDTENITSTSLRKYLATVVQIMNLKENEMDQIASHLGHDITVHRKYYRLQNSTVELCKIARLLMRTEETLGDGLDDNAS